MIELIISGGQTGADQAGWRAAKRFGIRTGGWMPKGFRTEDGDRPDLAKLYHAREHNSPVYTARTLENAKWADLTIWFGRTNSCGYICTLRSVRMFHKPFWTVTTEASASPEKIAKNLSLFDYKIINIAGNRGSHMMRGDRWVEDYLCEVFRRLGFQETSGAGTSGAGSAGPASRDETD